MHIVHVFSTFDPGGPQVRTADLIARLPDGFEHSILAMDGRYGCRERTPEARVRAWLHVDELPSGRFLPTRLARYVMAQEPDVVATYNWGAIETVFGLGRKGFAGVIHHEEGFGPEELQRQKRRRVLARRFILRKVHALVVPSSNLERIATTVWKLRPELVQMIPNGIDLTKFEADAAGQERAAAKRSFGLPADSIVIGSVGHLRPEKNYGLLLDAFIKLSADPRLRLLLVGDGVDRAEIESIVRSHSLEDRVVLTGRLEDPRDAYRAFDIFVISSKTEQMPISLLEAMAIGRAVASTDVGDVRTMLAPANREFVGDPDRLVTYVERLVDDRELRENLARQNRDWCATEYPIELCVERYRELYESARRTSKDRR